MQTTTMTTAEKFSRIREIDNCLQCTDIRLMQPSVEAAENFVRLLDEGMALADEINMSEITDMSDLQKQVFFQNFREIARVQRVRVFWDWRDYLPKPWEWKPAV